MNRSIQRVSNSAHWDYADTLRWNYGRHAFSIGGGNNRRSSTKGYNEGAYAGMTVGQRRRAVTPQA